jgi:parallel beta-helix repeat protein
LAALITAVGLATVALAAAPGTASADPVSCGAVITEDTTLDVDLTDCPGPALVIGADGVTVDLAGHTVSSACSTNTPGFATIDDTGGYDKVRILNGTVQSGSDAGVGLVDSTGSVLDGLVVERCATAPGVPGVGISLTRSDHNRVLDTTVSGGDPAVLLSASGRNVISGSSISGGIAIHAGLGIQLLDGSDGNRLSGDRIGGEAGAITIIGSADNRITRNTVADNGGISLADADETVISRNDLGPGPIGGDALDMSGASDDNVITRNNADGSFIISGDGNRVAQNDVSGFTTAIEVLSGDANLVLRNHATSVDDGIGVRAEATQTQVEHNVANGSLDDGIDVAAPGTLIRHNTANNNGDLGIEAVAGVIDGGQNRAAGNGNPLQCVNVVCR